MCVAFNYCLLSSHIQRPCEINDEVREMKDYHVTKVMVASSKIKLGDFYQFQLQRIRNSKFLFLNKVSAAL